MHITSRTLARLVLGGLCFLAGLTGATAAETDRAAAAKRWTPPSVSQVLANLRAGGMLIVMRSRAAQGDTPAGLDGLHRTDEFAKGRIPVSGVRDSGGVSGGRLFSTLSCHEGS